MSDTNRTEFLKVTNENKKEIKITFFGKNHIGDPVVTKFNNFERAKEYIYDTCLKQEDEKTVYLITWGDPNDDDTEIYVTSDFSLPELLLENLALLTGADFTIWLDIHLQLYDSFEEAYKVSLSMKETSPLCYSPEPNININ